MRRILGIGLLAIPSYVYAAKSPNKFHIWGNSRYEPRPGFPDDILNFSNFFPKLINLSPSSPSMKKIRFGASQVSGLDESGNIHIWPKHTLMNVKVPEVDDKHREIKLLQKGRFVDIHWTKGILFALNNRGEVWQWRFDQSESPPARKIPTLKNITKISTGHDHMVAIDKNGAVWSMGDDTFGQCGISTFRRQVTDPYLQLRYPNPVMVPTLPSKAVDIVCGKYHTLAVLEDGTVWGWGRNNKLQLGNTEQKLGKAPVPVVYEPVKILGLGFTKVHLVAAGDFFSIFVANDKDQTEVYGCGINSHGELGLGFLTHTTEIIKIQNLSNFVVADTKKNTVRDVKIAQIECGSEHCLALMDVGAVYSWGANENGEQGNKKRVPIDRPRLMKRYVDKEVVSINAGLTNSAVVFKN